MGPQWPPHYHFLRVLPERVSEEEPPLPPGAAFCLSVPVDVTAPVPLMGVAGPAGHADGVQAWDLASFKHDLVALGFCGSGASGASVRVISFHRRLLLFE